MNRDAIVEREHLRDEICAAVRVFVRLSDSDRERRMTEFIESMTEIIDILEKNEGPR